MTLDGKITSENRSIKMDHRRICTKEVQHICDIRYMGIMAGIGTVLADDPMLNVQVEKAGKSLSGLYVTVSSGSRRAVRL